MSAESDRLAQCRREFEAAMRSGCSIPELREQRKRDRRTLRARARGEVNDHTNKLMSGPSEAPETDFLRFDAAWMMRE